MSNSRLGVLLPQEPDRDDTKRLRSTETHFAIFKQDKARPVVRRLPIGADIKNTPRQGGASDAMSDRHLLPSKQGVPRLFRRARSSFDDARFQCVAFIGGHALLGHETRSHIRQETPMGSNFALAVGRRSSA